MARFNVEDSIWTDIRFTTLSKKIGETSAIGSVVILWRTGQKYWKQDRSLIPKNLFKLLEFSNELCEHGFVQEEETGFYCIGAQEHWDWLIDRIEAAKKAGCASAAARTRGINNLGATKRQPNATKRQPNATKRNPLTPTLPLAPSHTQEEERNTIDQSAKRTVDRKCVFDFELIYEKYPKKIGKQKGLKTFKTQIKADCDFQQLSLAIDRYVEYVSKNITDKKYIKQFDTFMNCWRDWMDPSTGNTKEIKKRDSMDEWLEKEQARQSNATA